LVEDNKIINNQTEIGFAITGFAIFKILAEMPSRPVAFLY
jgi:hypothetical protein